MSFFDFWLSLNAAWLAVAAYSRVSASCELKYVVDSVHYKSLDRYKTPAAQVYAV